MKLISQYLKSYYEYSLSFNHKPSKIEEYKILGITDIKTLEVIYKVSLKDSLELRIKLKKIHNFIIKTFFLLLSVILIPVWIYFTFLSIKEFSIGSIIMALFFYPLLALMSILSFIFSFMCIYALSIIALQEVLAIKSVRKIKLLDKIDEKLKTFRTKIYRFEGDIEYICNYDSDATWIKQSGMRSNRDELADWIINICTKSELSGYKKESNKFYRGLLMRVAFIIEDYKLNIFKGVNAVFDMPTKTGEDIERLAKKYFKDKMARENFWECYKNALAKQASYIESFDVATKQK